jgi:hypothetical protein
MKYSEYIHRNYQLNDFKLTGDPVKDADRFVELFKEPYWDKEYTTVIRNTAMFRFSFGEMFSVYTLTDGVVGKIIHTKIENMPKEVPVLMRSSFLIESRQETLFDNIQSIGGLILNNEIYLIFSTIDENLCSQTFSKFFNGIRINDINMIYNYDENNDPPDTIYMKERKDILSFVTVFSLMMEAKRTPFVVETKNNKNRDNNKSKRKDKTDWIERRVYIDRNIRYKNRTAGNAELDKNGKYLKDSLVHGFLREQRCGKGLSETEWIYIDDYDSTRWANKGDTRIIVDMHDK